MACVAVQFAVLPNFSHLVFPDSARVEEALRVVLQLRRRVDTGNAIAQVLTRMAVQTGGTGTVGDLRRFTDHEWRQFLSDVPAVCRLLLKHLLRQSSRGDMKGAISGPSDGSHADKTPVAAAAVAAAKELTFMERLQHDYNFGQPFDMTAYAQNLAVLANMGFKRDESMEALCVVDNKNVESALELLFIGDVAIRRRRRDDAVERLQRRSSTAISIAAGQPHGEMSNGAPGSGAEIASLMTQLNAVRKQYDMERAAKARVETEHRQMVDAQTRMYYREFLRGLLTDDAAGLKTYREKNKVSNVDHTTVCKDLSVSAAKLDNLKRFDARQGSECVVCLDRPRDHAVMPCAHFCLCTDCSAAIVRRSNACPICSTPIRNVVKIYM